MECVRFVLLLLMSSIKFVRSYYTKGSECVAVDAFNRTACSQFVGGTASQCESTFDEATSSLCCYDDRTNDVPWCFVGAADNSAPYVPPVVQPSSSPGVPFSPTSDILGNTVPQGTVSNLFPTPNPGTGGATGESLESLLQSLGISTEAPFVNTPVGSFLAGGVRPTVPAGVNRTVALCSYILLNRNLPEVLTTVFGDTIRQCGSITTTVSPEIASAVLQSEIQNILGANSNRVPTTTSPPRTPAPVNSQNFNNLLNLLGSNGGGTPSFGGAASGLAGLLGNQQTSNNINPFATLLANNNNNNNNNNNLLSGLLGGSTGGTSGLAGLLGGSTGGTSGLAGLLGGSTGGTSGLASLLSGSSGSSIASLLGGGNRNPLLGGGNSNSILNSLLGGGGSSATNLIGSLLGGNNNNNNGGTSNSLLTLLLSQSLGSQQNRVVNSVIGSQLPDFIGTTPAPRYNPFVCQILLGNSGLLSSLGSGGGLSNLLTYQFRSSLLQQNGCLQNLLSNPLLLLQGGGLDALRNSLGPILGLTSSTTDASTGDGAQGPLDPSKIPPDVLTRCRNERATLNTRNNCKVGIHVNIQTEQECLNIGCIFAPGNMCFRCPYVPVSALLNQLPQPSCNVPSAERAQCSGFSSTLLLSSVFSQQQLINSRSVNTAGVTTANNSSSSGAAAAYNSNGLGPRVGTPSNSGSNTGNTNYLINPLDARAPATRQGLLGSLGGLGGLTSGLGGLGGLTSGLGGLGGLTSGLGGLGGLTSGLGGFGGLGGGFNNILLQRNCESRGCCWDSSNNLFSAANSCYEKSTPTIPGSSVDCLSSLICGKSPTGLLARIIGGTPATTNEDRPWQVLIRLSNSNQVRCSGAIICGQWIVTTASCLVTMQNTNSALGSSLNIQPSTLTVTVGSFSPTSPGTIIPVTRIIPHPYYRVTQNYHDIALLQVPNLIFRPNVQPVCLPAFAATTIAADQTIYVAGYGQTSLGSTTSSALKEIKVTTQSMQNCRNVYQTSLPIDGVFCGTPATSGEDTCTGDRGSPAVSYDSTSDTFTLVGLNFAGSTDCSGSTPLLFVDMADYRDWIRKTTNGCCSVPGVRTG